MERLSSYQKISPTAKFIAFLRQYSDLPLASEICELVGAEEMMKEWLKGEPLSEEILRWFAPFAEARYKSIRRAIQRSGVRQVLEFASGFSFRGAAMTEEASLIYVETDLPEIHEERTELRRKLEGRGSLAHRSNLFFESANLLSPIETQNATKHLRPNEKVVITHEGLFQYLSMEEKKRAAETIRDTLKRFGGVWITPDFGHKAGLATQNWYHPQLAMIRNLLTEKTERSLSDAAFEDEDHVMTFFKALGFEIWVDRQMDGSFRLSSAQRFKTTEKELAGLNATLDLWTLEAK
jgi:O-methyltransferase involved in polyketide biosynthesis